jgi:anti-sigma factor ChrR (cupin superfamily)
MRLNADFSRRAFAHTTEADWVASPMPGVTRRMLDRIGDEVARATSIVRYAPGSRFSPHTHDGGEEFLVLEGVFQDEHASYPAGCYVRNPPTSRHTPASADGCTIFVRLHQFDPADRKSVHVDASASKPWAVEGRDGVAQVALYEDAREQVRIEHWAPGQAIALADHAGLEVFVLDGGFDEGGEGFVRHSWLRLPPDQSLAARVGPYGARVFVKSGHLAALAVAAETDVEA